MIFCRYTGEDEDVIDEESRGTSAKQILEKIKKDAEARRKSKSKTEVNRQDEKDILIKTKKKKKHKKVEKSWLTVDSDGEIDCLQQRLLDETDRKTNLKRKVSLKVSKKKEETESSQQTSDEDVSPTKKKKKKSLSNEVRKTKAKNVEESDEKSSPRKLNTSYLDSDEDDQTDNVCLESLQNEELLNSEKSESHNDNEIGGFTVIGEVKGKKHNQVCSCYYRIPVNLEKNTFMVMFLKEL